MYSDKLDPTRATSLRPYKVIVGARFIIKVAIGTAQLQWLDMLLIIVAVQRKIATLQDCLPPAAAHPGLE